jgi:hypothetical protein
MGQTLSISSFSMKKIVISISVLCIGIFLIAHIGEAMINYVLIEPEVQHKHYRRTYGDLYYMTQIDHFKEPLSQSSRRYKDHDLWR